MKKNVCAKAVFCALGALLCISCSKKEKVNLLPVSEEITEISVNAKDHFWYYLTENSIEEIDLPQHAPETLLKPWTEAVRISSFASLPAKNASSFDAYALVNRSGMIAFKKDSQTLYCDTSIFSLDTADSIVFSDSTPVFYLYRSTFFNEKSSSQNDTIHSSRPFLVEFNSDSRIFYPLVSYANLNLLETDQISGFFWNGTKWACSVKSTVENGVEFSYFSWEPVIELTDLSPALNKDVFVFSSSSEAEYRGLNMPQLFENAPLKLKKLLSSIPEEFPFYVSFRDESGTSPVSYFQQGNGSVPLNACAFCAPASDYIAAVFEEGTTYLFNTATEKSTAFRLPRLPAGWKYTEAAVSGQRLLAAWEENDFYKTGRAGFISVDLSVLLGE